LYTLNRTRNHALAPLALLITGTTWAGASTSTIASPIPGGLAFARYIASVHRRDPFRESGLVAVVIEASLASLQRKSHLVALRKARESERSEYTVLESDGDATVTQEVIAPYLAEQEQIENLPVSSVIITPTNYNFHFMGEATIANTLAAVFRIVPKKKLAGLIRGELWIDPATGAAVLEAGYFVKTSAADIRRIDIVRDMKLQDGSSWSRITHLAVQTRRAGRGYLSITEFLPAGTSAILEPAFPLRCDWRSSSHCGQNWNWRGSPRQHTMTKQTTGD
jgi:hypothetical protein